MTTMKSTHTKGPWSFKASATLNDEPCEWDIYAPCGGVVASTNSGTSDADTRLIAAAPEMLDALRRLTHPMASDEDLENALAVIAKAEGRDS